MHRYVSLLAVLALAACEPIEIEPSRPDGALLEAGRYDLVIKEVVASACDGEDVAAGQVLPAELRRSEDGVTFTFVGWVLHGTMEPGNLHVQGVVDPPETTPMEDPDEPEVIDESDSEGEVEPVEHAGEGRPHEEAPGDVAEPRASALLDASILASDHAEGSLFVSVPGCEVELAVVIGPPRHGETPTEPPVEHEDDEPPRDEPGEVGEGEDGEVPPT